MIVIVLFAVAVVVAVLVVDRLVRSGTDHTGRTGRYPQAGQGSDADVERLIRTGRKIEAIKLHREPYGGGLAEAKEAVEALGVRLEREGGSVPIEP